MTTTDDLGLLLKKLEIINLKYSAQYKEANFNVFSILRNDHDEVHLHSAFIAELLNPKGSHGCGCTFLEHFLQEVDIDRGSALETRSVFVDVERRYSEFGQIDILLKIPGRIIILENKVYAGDQKAQLKRYFQFALARGYKKDQIHILYLTLNGTDPSPESLDGLDLQLITRISYRKELLRWLDRCVRHASLLPALRETIAQYQNLVKKLTGTSMNEANTSEVIDLLSKGDNALLGKTVIDAWGEMKYQTTLKFWEELEGRLTALVADFPAFKVLPLEKYDGQRLDRFFNRRRGRDIYFGLCATLRPLAGSSADAVALYLEMGDGMLYFLITIVRNDKTRDVADEPAFAPLADQIRHCSDPGFRNKWCLGGKYFKSRNIDFFNFRNEDTVGLVNPQRRKETIESLYAEITDFLKVSGIAAGGFEWE
jgi:hypothetical protein